MLDRLHGNQFFQMFDILLGYHALRLQEKAVDSTTYTSTVEKTAFYLQIWSL
jgi:hypothetical protein